MRSVRIDRLKNGNRNSFPYTSSRGVLCPAHTLYTCCSHTHTQHTHSTHTAHTAHSTPLHTLHCSTKGITYNMGRKRPPKTSPCSVGLRYFESRPTVERSPLMRRSRQPPWGNTGQARSDCSIENIHFLFPGTGKKQVISW